MAKNKNKNSKMEKKSKFPCIILESKQNPYYWDTILEELYELEVYLKIRSYILSKI